MTELVLSAQGTFKVGLCLIFNFNKVNVSTLLREDDSVSTL